MAWGMVLLCVAVAGWLVPDSEQLADRHEEDAARARAVAEAAARVVPELPPVVAVSVPPLERLRLALAGDEKYDALEAIAVAGDPAACLAQVKACPNPLSHGRRGSLFAAAGRSALGAGQPELAAQIFQEAVRVLPDVQLLKGAVEAARYSSQPETALSLLEVWKSEGRRLTAALEDVQVTLCRETNQPQQALELLLPRLAAQEAQGGVDERGLLLALEVAAQAGNVGAVLPSVEACLGRKPGGNVPWQELPDVRPQPDAAWRRLAKLLAQHAEWGGAPGAAMDWYLRLAITGDLPALERIRALYPGLNREGDWMRLLARITPVQGQPKLTRELARLQASAALYDAADRTYAQWLRTHADDAPAWAELAAMYEEMGSPEKARGALQRAIAISPGDIALRKDMAELYTADQNFQAAFNIYSSLTEAQHDAASLENYGLLAEALADYPAHNKAQLLRLHRLKTPKAVDYLEAARSCSVIGEEEKAAAVLTDGLRRDPNSRVLRIELAQALRGMEKYEEAITLLGHEPLKTDLRAMSLFIECCSLAERYAYALTFLGMGFEKRFSFPPDIRIDLGHIYYNNGHLDQADALYSSVPDEPGMWPLLADARYRRGDFAGAESCQRKYLKSNRAAGPRDWIFMGDILKALGRTGEADEAYATSMTLMQNKVGMVSGARGRSAP